MIPRLYSLHTGDPHCSLHTLLSPKQKCVDRRDKQQSNTNSSLQFQLYLWASVRAQKKMCSGTLYYPN